MISMYDIDGKNRIAVAIGDFDGMHRAHKTVITGAQNVVIYSVNNSFSLLQKSIFTERYPNAVFSDFDKIRNMDGNEFLEKIIIGEFNAGMVLCGFNFRFGRNAGWSALDMRNYLEAKDIWVRILEHLDFENEPISSSRIRTEILNGNIQKANDMLGYNFTYESSVISGDRRGRTLGYPTINQHLPEGLVIPCFGVYESRAFVDGKEYKAFTNIGKRPTWRVDTPLSETHIFDFDKELYGKNVRIELVKYLRGERKFSSADELKKQLEYDKSSII